MISLRELLRYCRRKNFRILKNNHYKIYIGNGKSISVSGTASDKNFMGRVLHDFKRNGIDVEEEIKRGL